MIGNEPHYQHQSPTQCSQDHLHFPHSCNKLRKAEGHLIKTWWCLLLVVAAMSFSSKLDSDASPLKLLNHLRTSSYMYSRTPPGLLPQCPKTLLINNGKYRVQTIVIPPFASAAATPLLCPCQIRSYINHRLR